MGNFHHKSLMVFASVSAYTAPTLMTVCLLTDHWIHGNQTKLSSNPMSKPGDTRILNYTIHHIGLWKECVRDVHETVYKCETVKYSKKEAKSEKGFKAVAYRSAPSMACFAAASGLLILAIVLFTRGLCKRRRKAVFFISGLLFSISGLITMVGVTLYVSITTEESVKHEQGNPVMYRSYGYSFLCAVFSFVLQELTGVLTVYWFIYRFRALVRKQEKLRERTRQMMGNCLSVTTAMPLNFVAAHASNHHPSKSLSNLNHIQYPSTSNENSYPFIYKKQLQQQQRRRQQPPPPPPPQFERSQTPTATTLPLNDRILYSVTRSPTLAYGDYCRVLIRAEDMDLLAQMVKSKSQAQLANSRPTTPAPSLPMKSCVTSHVSRRTTHKGVKRTTSV